MNGDATKTANAIEQMSPEQLGAIVEAFMRNGDASSPGVAGVCEHEESPATGIGNDCYPPGLISARTWHVPDEAAAAGPFKHALIASAPSVPGALASLLLRGVVDSGCTASMTPDERCLILQAGRCAIGLSASPPPGAPSLRLTRSFRMKSIIRLARWTAMMRRTKSQSRCDLLNRMN